MFILDFEFSFTDGTATNQSDISVVCRKTSNQKM
jgi:hypothetical protein